MVDVPEDFDWVKARAGCTPTAAFSALKKVVSRDVDIANDYTRHKLEFQVSKEIRFGVLLSSPHTGAAIGSRRFELNEETGLIEFYTIDQPSTDADAYTPSLTFKPRLSSDGVRIFGASNGSSYQLWEVSRIALEPLIFR